MEQTIVKTYKGTEAGAAAAFQEDAKHMASKGYVPVNQTWAPGSYGCGSFIVALLLCIILIGFLIFIYMLIVKPDGTLTVTYALSAAALAGPEKTCPQCAEKVRAAAKVCRFCGFNFPDQPQPTSPASVVKSTPNSGAYALGQKAGKLFGPKK